MLSPILDLHTLPTYAPEPWTDFSDPANATAFRAALDAVRRELGRTYPLVIGGERIVLPDTFPSVNPANPEEVVGYFANGTADHADAALAAATEAFPAWAATDPGKRAAVLLRAAAEMRRRKHEFSAVMVLEVGKSWAEADADTAEAIDFLEYYARQILELHDSSAKLTPYAPENLRYWYIPLGVGAVIPPWNFPNAILTGTTSAPIVAGNTVVLKPAEQSVWIGWKVAELLWDAGLPPGVLNFVTGPGDVVGARLVASPKTRFIAFTGSKAVGLHINRVAAEMPPGQKWLKRAVLEMGGKDAVVVDETADLDAAAAGIVASAFGFQGQKCSAGSRAIIVDAVYDDVARRVVERAAQLRIGDPQTDATVDLGPVVDADAQNKINGYIALGKQQHTTLLHNPQAVPQKGYFVPPTIFGDVPPDARVAQEEIFGPVLALIRARDFDDALHIANDTEYGLTGSVYSQDRARLERAAREYFVGNLYLNRKSTGALVGVHPFGGYNLSGTASKAGGPDYLLLFTQGKSIAEKR